MLTNSEEEKTHFHSEQSIYLKFGELCQPLEATSFSAFRNPWLSECYSQLLRFITLSTFPRARMVGG